VRAGRQALRFGARDQGLGRPSTPGHVQQRFIKNCPARERNGVSAGGRLEPNTRGTHRPAVADLRSAVSSGSCSARPGPASPLAVVRLRQPAPAAARGAAQAALCRRAGDAQLHERGSSRRARLAAGSRTARLKLAIETASSLLIFASARAAAALAAIIHERPTNSYIQG
jgi:hypothetical protein